MIGGRKVWAIALMLISLWSSTSAAQIPKASPSATAEHDGSDPPSAASAASSQASEAQDAFKQAEEAFAQGNYADAARAFDLADRLAPHPSVVFNAAVAWDHAGDSPRAATNYKRALSRDDLPPEQADEASKRLAELGQRLVYVQLNRPLGATVSVGHIQNEVIPARFFLEPGKYELILQDGPMRRVEELSLVRGKNAQFNFSPLRAAEPAPPSDITEPAQEPTPSRAQEISGWVLLGVGVLAAGAAVYMGQEGLAARAKYLNSGRLDRDSFDRAYDLRLGSNIATGGAGLLGATGIVLLLTSSTIRF